MSFIIFIRILFVTAMTIMMVIVAIAYWRWTSRMAWKEPSFRSEKFTISDSSEIQAADVPALMQINKEYMRISQLVERAVVSIETTGISRDAVVSENGEIAESKSMTVHGLGSGVIVSKEGHIITAYHVIRNKHALRVTLSNGRNVSVRLIGVDEELDIAVLQVDNARLKFEPIPFGDSELLKPGMMVLACGNPYGLGATVSRGIISSRARKLVDSGLTLIQTDTPIFPGNSGGPLVNIFGEIVGINKSVLSDKDKNYGGIGFAIPSNHVLHSFAQICRHGRPMRGYLGFDIVPSTPPLRSYLDYHDANGVVVNLVKPGSPAEQAGLMCGDIIQRYNNIDIYNVDELQKNIENLIIGDKFKLTIWRKGQKLSLSMRVGDRILQSIPTQWENFMDEFGMTLREFTAEEQSIGARGLLVTHIEEKNPVNNIMNVGDIIFAVNHKPITSLENFAEIIRKGEAILSVSRDVEQFNVKVNVRSTSAQTDSPPHQLNDAGGED